MTHMMYEDVVGSLHVEEHPDIGWILHVYIYQWSKEAFKHSMRVFDNVLNDLADHNVKELSALISIDNRKLQKFAAAYGFIRTGKQMILPDNSEDRLEHWTVSTGVI